MLVIPTIDFQGYDETDPITLRALSESVAQAMSGTGFMRVRNLGIERQQVEKMFGMAEWFFSQDFSEKQHSSYSAADENFGFQKVGIEHLNPNQPADIKETFTMRDLASHDPEDPRWPNREFRETATHYYDACLEGAHRIQRVCAHALAVDQEFFVDCHRGENVSLRLLHYPSTENYSIKPGQLGAGAHTDYGMLTLLFENGVGGLQVQDSGLQWHDVIPEPGTIVINTGDLLERWTNGKFRSTLHRVKPMVGGKGRLSIAMFVDPDSSTKVAAIDSCVNAGQSASYHEVIAGEYIQNRIEASHRRGIPMP